MDYQQGDIQVGYHASLTPVLMPLYVYLYYLCGVRLEVPMYLRVNFPSVSTPLAFHTRVCP